MHASSMPSLLIATTIIECGGTCGSTEINQREIRHLKPRTEYFLKVCARLVEASFVGAVNNINNGICTRDLYGVNNRYGDGWS
jgi:hypothetical protein